jgi:hypothetical protein
VQTVAANIRSMSPEELEGVRRVCASLLLTIDLLLELADDRAQAEPAESLAG